MNERVIYEVYTDKDKNIHCERRAVAYSNDTYVYYIVNGSKELKWRERIYIFKNLKCYIDVRNDSNRVVIPEYFHIYLFEKPIEEELREFLVTNINLKKERLQKKMQEYYDAYTHNKSQYDYYKEELEKLTRENK